MTEYVFERERPRKIEKVVEAPGKCLGNRRPPCGRATNCAGFYKGYACGGHAEPVKGCSRRVREGLPRELFHPLALALDEQTRRG